MYTKAMAAFRESYCLHLVCRHQRYAKLCVVEDQMKQSYGRPLCVLSEKILVNSGNRVTYLSPRPLCLYGLVCCERNIKKDGPNQYRLFYCCPKGNACSLFAWKPKESRVVNTS